VSRSSVARTLVGAATGGWSAATGDASTGRDGAGEDEIRHISRGARRDWGWYGEESGIRPESRGTQRADEAEQAGNADGGGTSGVHSTSRQRG
jgi:hypothetical protein